MTAAGWIFMVTSISCVIGLCAVCFRRVLRSTPSSDASAERHDEQG